jgi:sugar-specific transcriptional regulator TrmB
MKINQLTETLKDLGLDENESRVYISMLSLGPSKVLRIAKESEIKRTTVYSVLESLRQKGLVAIQVKGLKKLYVAESPEQLERMFELKREKFKSVLPELKALETFKGNESFIKYYEGLSGIKSVYDRILDDLKPGNDYLIVSNMEQFLDMDREYFASFIKRRAKANLKVKTLLLDSPSARHYKMNERSTNQSVRFLPSDTKLSANLVITPHRVVMTQTVAPIMSIVIENKNIVEMQKEQFDIIWDSIK